LNNTRRGSADLSRRRRGAVNGNRQKGFSAKVLMSKMSSKISGTGSGLLDFDSPGDIYFDSDDEDSLDDLAYIKRTMPKKRSLSCQVLGDSNVAFNLVHSERRQRRMSFPTYDLKVWKEERVLNMMV